MEWTILVVVFSFAATIDTFHEISLVPSVTDAVLPLSPVSGGCAMQEADVRGQVAGTGQIILLFLMSVS